MVVVSIEKKRVKSQQEGDRIAQKVRLHIALYNPGRWLYKNSHLPIPARRAVKAVSQIASISSRDIGLPENMGMMGLWNLQRHLRLQPVLRLILPSQKLKYYSVSEMT